MKRQFVFVSVPVCLTIVGSAGYFVGAGDLNPPLGAIAPTHKTLTEIEPRIAINSVNTPGVPTASFRIIASGSYYLTSDLIGETGKNGILVGANNVTIDLNGFNLRGAGGQTSLDGIVAQAIGAVNVTVLNGTLDGWGGDGIDMMSSTANIRVSGISLRSIGGMGIKVGLNSIVENCQAFSCTMGGILTGNGCTVEKCAITTCNNGDGISVGEGCAIRGCSAQNTSRDGFVALSGTILSDCRSHFSGDQGFICVNSTLHSCSAIQNEGVGMNTSGGSISHCVAEGNASDGFNSSQNPTLFACTAKANGGEGIAVSFGASVKACSAYDNGGNGIEAWSDTSYAGASVIADCSSISNDGDGIRVRTDCLVIHNTCISNGDSVTGAGIRATAPDNRIEGNNCNKNAVGIDVDGSGNLIIRNTCSGNTTNNWSITSNNIHGPIIDRTTPFSPVVMGNAAASSLGSTDANANFSY